MIFQVKDAFLSKLVGKSVEATSIYQPVQEHLHCRSEGKAALFDMSFLTQLRWHGKDCVEFLEKILVGDIASLEVGNGILSVITNASGGIVDDAIITNVGDHFIMTIHDSYEAHFKDQMESFDGEVFMEYFQHSILALQGPGAPAVMSKVLPPDFELELLEFMSSSDVFLLGSEDLCRIARCGFTGEDGFELHIPTAEAAFTIASKLLEDPNVMPASLQALDTLRLEAGLRSKGKELCETVSPVEAGLGWTISRRRRREGGFLGADSILTRSGKLQKVNRTCVGMVCLTQVPEVHAEIFDAGGSIRIGVVTSAAFSPSTKMPIAMGYVEKAFSKPGTDLLLKCTLKGGENEPKTLCAKVVEMPFVETHFYKIPPVRDPATGEEFEISGNEQAKIIDSITMQSFKHAGESDLVETSFHKIPPKAVRDPATGEEFEISGNEQVKLFGGIMPNKHATPLPLVESDFHNPTKAVRDVATGEEFCGPTAPSMKEHDSISSEEGIFDYSAPLGDDIFHSPCSVATKIFETDMVQVPKIKLSQQNFAGKLKKIRDPSTGEVFDCAH